MPPPPEPTARSRGEEVAPAAGTAFLHSADGVTPLAGLPLMVHGIREGTFVKLDVVTDADGRYAVDGLQREYIMVSVGPQNVYVSPCSVRRFLRTNERLDMHVAAKADILTSGIPATLRPLADLYWHADVVWGVVTEQRARRPRPIAGATVEHFYTSQTDPTGFTVTDANGLYELCMYWDDYGQDVHGRKPGYPTVTHPIGAESRIDFDLTKQAPVRRFRRVSLW